MSIQKVIDRIKKLTALSTSSNAHEAAAAAAEAQRLMTEYRIAEAQLEADGQAVDETVYGEDILNLTGAKRPQNWLIRLASGCARANNCRITIVASTHYGRKGAINLFGRKDDINATKYIYSMLVNEINRLGKEFNAHDKGATHAFKLGAAVAIVDRLIGQKHASMKQASSTALIVINKADKAAQDHVNRIITGTYHMAGTSNTSAFNQGKEAGRNVNLGNASKHLNSSPKMIGDN